MPEIINLEEEFNSWIDILNLEDFDSISDLLRAAYLHGIKTAANDSCKTLSDYSVALEGCTDYEYYPSQAYDAASDSLYMCWKDILKDKQ